MTEQFRLLILCPSQTMSILYVILLNVVLQHLPQECI